MSVNTSVCQIKMAENCYDRVVSWIFESSMCNQIDATQLPISVLLCNLHVYMLSKVTALSWSKVHIQAGQKNHL